jgi:hypothetical protein
MEGIPAIVADGQIIWSNEHAIKEGSQHTPDGGGFDGQIVWTDVHCIRVGSQQPVGGTDGLPVIETLEEGQIG